VTAPAASAVEPIVPPATLGILGGGQLGRYFVLAATQMGYRTMVLEPDPEAPAGRVADVHLVAAYDDPAALAELAGECAVVTTEFENPPAAALDLLAARVAVRPSPAAIAIAQDRIAEKRFLEAHGIPVAPWAPVLTGDAHPPIEYPAILKTARLGYDGKGQRELAAPGELAPAWHRLGDVPCVVEQRVPLTREVSVVLGRSVTGAVASYPVVENVHQRGILDATTVPARAAGAIDLAVTIADALDYVGILAVEMFDCGGELLVNELAPRPHNSGHWTLDAAHTSQFQQQVRAVCGLPLGDPGPTVSAAAMVNLLGELWADGTPRWAAALADPAAHLHLYGKREARAGRKMGHLTVTADTPAEAVGTALELRAGTLLRP
jgi:5-(carboxyamino)imidazole ribonucleotide synthase